MTAPVPSKASASPHVLLVNPWIHDFAAYDFWAKPHGLLLLGSVLRNAGCTVSYIDCLDRFHPQASWTDSSARMGRGPYLKKRLVNPPGLSHIRRTYSQYGIPEAWVLADLTTLSKPDVILVTGIMTYWYPGVRETIRVIRAVFPDTPVILGGIYASLCPDHARRHCGADRVVTGPAVVEILSIVSEVTGEHLRRDIDSERPDTWPMPAFDLEHRIPFVTLLTTVGCPFFCAYCASRHLSPRFLRRSPVSVAAEIAFWQGRHGVRDFVFYDDALLVGAASHAVPILEAIVDMNLSIRFHTPNAVHIREITDPVAMLMKKAGFQTLRLGLETAAFDRRRDWDAKVTAEEFHRAVGCLKRAGFSGDQVGAYLLMGLPGQSMASVATSISVVRSAGVTPILAHYTPIPHTRLWPEAMAASPYDLAADPVYTNNAIMPCRPEGFSWQTLSRLKRFAAEGVGF